MLLIEAQSRSMMTSFHVAERANPVHIWGGIFSLWAGKKEVFLQRRRWLVNDSELFGVVELTYSIVILSQVTQRIQNQTNGLLTTIGSYYDEIIGNGFKTSRVPGLYI